MPNSPSQASQRLRRALTIAGCVVFPLCAQMQSIRGGTFNMGVTGGTTDESPEHSVTLSAYGIDKYEVTRGEYDSCAAAGACSPAHNDDGKCVGWNGQRFIGIHTPDKVRGPRHPVICVTWYQARDYCAFKGKKLPTEAQWEYAALAGGAAEYAWGNGRPASRCIQAADGGPATVGSFKANPWGIFDMTGNVWEWTNDRYQPDYYESSEESDPPGPDVGQYRVIRGGGWYSGPAEMRIKNRHWFEPNFSEVSIGFRCAQ